MLEELHVEFEDLPLEQYGARDELPLMQQWARGMADDCVTLPADLETMDLYTTAISQPTLRAAEPRRLRNDFEDFFGTRPRRDKSTEQILPEDYSSAPSLLRTHTSGREVRAQDVRQSPLSAPILLALHQCHARHLVLHRWSRGLAFGGSAVPWRGRYALFGRNRRTTRGQRRILFAEEVLQRFRVALTKHLESDAELFLAEVAHVPLRWRRFLEFCDHSETRIRATSQVAFADVVDSHCGQQELIELPSWVRDKWWLRLSPEDVHAVDTSSGPHGRLPQRTSSFLPT